jgi:hypothetical protein
MHAGKSEKEANIENEIPPQMEYIMNKENRKLFSAGEIVNLLGVVFLVMSAAYPWEKQKPLILPNGGALYVASHVRLLTGYDIALGPTSVGWVVVLCALICGALLLFTPSNKENVLFFVVQVAISLFGLCLVVLHFGVTAGALGALAGVIFLLSGAVLRYQQMKKVYAYKDVKN